MTTLDSSRPMAASGRTAAAFAALILGAAAMGVSPVFVRFAEVGPFASAFWRVALALPALWLWARLERGGSGRTPAWDRATIIAGLMFTGDLLFWHLAIHHTTMANATLLAVLAPVWVAMGSWLFIGERAGRGVAFGLLFCLAGAAALVGSSFALAPERLLGDLFGFATSLFFGGYFLAVRVARRTVASGLLLYRSSLVTAAILFVVAVTVEDRMLPTSLYGAGALVLLAFVSHLGGQGLLAFALGHLSATFSSLVIFLEAVFAALFGFLVFGEALTPMQAVGGVAILVGIWVARPRRAPT